MDTIINFFTGDNWVINLILFAVAIAGLIFAILEYRKKSVSKKANVRKSKKVAIKQKGEGEANVDDSEEINIQQ